VPSSAVAQSHGGKKDLRAKQRGGCFESGNIGYGLLVGHNGIDPQLRRV
jgi:hypothetical protein